MRRCLLIALAAVLACLALGVVDGAGAEPARPFVGTWWAIDFDGSLQKATFGEHGRLVYTDDYSTTCGGGKGTSKATGTVSGAGDVFTWTGSATFVCERTGQVNGLYDMKFVIDHGTLTGGWPPDFVYTWSADRLKHPFAGDWWAIDLDGSHQTLNFGDGGSMFYRDDHSTTCGGGPGTSSAVGWVTGSPTGAYTWDGRATFVCELTGVVWGPFDMQFVNDHGVMTGGWPGAYVYTWSHGKK